MQIKRKNWVKHLLHSSDNSTKEEPGDWSETDTGNTDVCGMLEQKPVQ